MNISENNLDEIDNLDKLFLDLENSISQTSQKRNTVGCLFSF